MDSESQTSPALEREQLDSSKPVDVWFDDGNLIIQAGEKSFRVYRGILSRTSSVFRDMLSLAVTNEDETIDGCPVVRVSDAAGDVSFFLKSLYDTEFFLPPPAMATFAATVGVLKLSTKYDVPFLRRRALLHLAVVYPITLEDWDASHGWLSPRTEDHFSAILLSRQFDIAWIRPMAIYSCMSRPISEICSIFQNTDLSPEDRETCMMAVQRLKASELMCISATVKSSSKCNSSSLICPRVDVGLAIIEKRGGADPLVTTKSILDTFKLCRVCAAFSRPEHVSERVRRWNTIPDILRCPSWNDLATEMARYADSTP